MPSRAPQGRSARAAVIVALALMLAGAAGAPGARAAAKAPLPVGMDRLFLENLTGAELSPGSTGAITLEVGNPLAFPIGGTVLTLDLYAFNAFPGNATSQVDVGSAPVLSNGSASGLEVNESLGTLAPGSDRALSVPVVTGTSTPSGTFAVRTSLAFTGNGSSYRLASRGWFTAALWSAATSGPNGSVVLNLTALGVSGILPETSVLVSSSDFSYVLGALLGGGVLLVATGAWLYFRRANSSSGTRPSPDATHAPRAFGINRTSDGD